MDCPECLDMIFKWTQLSCLFAHSLYILWLNFHVYSDLLSTYCDSIFMFIWTFSLHTLTQLSCLFVHSLYIYTVSQLSCLFGHSLYILWLNFHVYLYILSAYCDWVWNVRQRKFSHKKMSHSFQRESWWVYVWTQALFFKIKLIRLHGHGNNLLLLYWYWLPVILATWEVMLFLGSSTLSARVRPTQLSSVLSETTQTTAVRYPGREVWGGTVPPSPPASCGKPQQSGNQAEKAREEDDQDFRSRSSSWNYAGKRRESKETNHREKARHKDANETRKEKEGRDTHLSLNRLHPGHESTSVWSERSFSVKGQSMWKVNPCERSISV